MTTENPTPLEETDKFLLRLPGENDAESFEGLFEPATILVRRARQLFGLERGEAGVSHVANEHDGVQTFKKGDSRYLLQYNRGYDASMVRTALKPGSNGELVGSMESFIITLDQNGKDANLYYSSLQFENGEMTTQTLSNDQNAIDAINQIVTSVDGELFD